LALSHSRPRLNPLFSGGEDIIRRFVELDVLCGGGVELDDERALFIFAMTGVAAADFGSGTWARWGTE
jgi:hypothetical protein